MALMFAFDFIRIATQIWNQYAVRSTGPAGVPDYFFASMPPMLWSLAMNLFAALLLWLCPPWLVLAVAGSSEPSDDANRGTDWGPALLSAVGFYYVLKEVPSLVEAYSASYGAKAPRDGAFPYLWSHLLMQLVALAVMIGGRRLGNGMRMFWKLTDEE